MAALQLLKLIDTSLCDILATQQRILQTAAKTRNKWKRPLAELVNTGDTPFSGFLATCSMSLHSFSGSHATCSIQLQQQMLEKETSYLASVCETCGAPTNIGDNWKDIINNLAILNKILDL